MKPIELLVRSDAWDEKTQRAFYAHLTKPMKDDARLEYCDRKAFFLARSGFKSNVAAAEKLLSWALATFTKAAGRARGSALATRSGLREKMGRFVEAAGDARGSADGMPEQAAASLHVARALLRANGLVATSEVLALEREVLADPHGTLLQAYAVWTYIVGATCARARGRDTRARTFAKKALTAIFGGPGEFEAWVKRRRRALLPELDLQPKEVDVIARLAEAPTTRKTSEKVRRKVG